MGLSVEAPWSIVADRVAGAVIWRCPRFTCAVAACTRR
jgi:hypothetical protein